MTDQLPGQPSVGVDENSALTPAELPVVGPGSGPMMPEAEGGEVGPVRSGWRLAIRSFAENKLALAGMALLVFFVLFCFIGPFVYRTNQVAVNLSLVHEPPSLAHPFGTDLNGYDELGQIMLGGQASLEVGVLAALIASIIGTFYGTMSGLIGALFDATLMRFVDILLSIPYLFIILIVASNFNASVLSISLIIASFAWLVPARLVRGEVLTLRVRDFVAASRVMGAGRWRLSIRHLIPNAMGVVIVNITFQVADAIIAFATLSFLGFGFHPPQVDWGDILYTGSQYAGDGYWWLIYPVAICLVVVVMACNFVGDAARDALEVRLQRR